MTIIKHGKFYSDIKDHIDLYGKCKRCGCEFKTFVDLYWDSPETGGATLITDPSCTHMIVKPEFHYRCPAWVGEKFIMQSEICGLRAISASISCPDCGESTELKV